MSSILVTGGTGLIGSFLVETLVRKNDVRCLVMKNTDTKFIDDLGVEFVYGDITDIKSLKPAVKGVDKVFHLAAAFKKDMPKNPTEDLYFKVNANGTENLLEVCKQDGVGRVVHFSASGVYGPSSDAPVNENSEYNPSDSYEKSKCEGEKIALKYNETGLPVTIVQPTIVYGPRETSVMLRFFKFIKDRRVIIGNGKNKFNFVYVEDVVDGAILASKEKNAIGQRYLLGYEKSYPMSDFVKVITSTFGVTSSKIKVPYLIAKDGVIFLNALCDLVGCTSPIKVHSVNFLAGNHDYDISKAKRELGYRPKVSLKEGVKITVKWYKDNNLI
jgi:nucleoside-diphosphate-sugar epimerase